MPESNRTGDGIQDIRQPTRNLDALPRLDPPTIRPHAILLRGSRLDFERDRVGVRIVDLQIPLHSGREGACGGQASECGAGGAAVMVRIGDETSGFGVRDVRENIPERS